MRLLLQALAGLVLSSQLFSQQIPQLNDATSGLPIRELMVFKDGHAMVYHGGRIKPDEDGIVEFRDLPKPILGTFWPSTSTPGWQVKSSTAGWRDVSKQVDADSLGSLITANPGAAVFVTEIDGKRYSATLPEKSTAMNSGGLALLRVDDGLKAVPLSRIREITFRDPDPVLTRSATSRERVLGFQLRQAEGAKKEVELGLSYVSAGFRWIPSYRIEIDGAGQAVVEMSATLVNDLRDIESCRLQLVVGVPNFSFASIDDPMALTLEAQSIARNSLNLSNGGTSNFFSNAISSQATSFSQPTNATHASTAPDMQAGRNHDDLYVFTVNDITLKKSHRMSVSLGKFALSYTDHYVLDIPIQVPREIHHVRSGGFSEADRLAMMPKVTHQIRLQNKTDMPLTTAPALIFSKGSVLAQTMVTYTPAKSESSITLTKAIDIQVEKDDQETDRILDALTLGRNSYHRVDYAGSITLANQSKKTATLEVKRYVIGKCEVAPKGAKLKTLSPFDDLNPMFGQSRSDYNMRHWPSWWRQVNGVEEISWTVVLDPGSVASLSYSWFYYWR